MKKDMPLGNIATCSTTLSSFYMFSNREVMTGVHLLHALNCSVELFKKFVNGNLQSPRPTGPDIMIIVVLLAGVEVGTR